MSNTKTIPKLAPGQIEDFPISKITNLQEALDTIPAQSDPYVHPTQTAITIGPLTGDNIVSGVSVNDLGHVTQVSTRVLTPQNIGAQPAGSYELNTNKSTGISLGSSNVLYPTQNAVKTYVDNQVSPKANNSILISTGTGLSGGGNLTANRTLSFDTVWGDNRYALKSISINAGSGISGGGNLSLDRTVSVDSTVLRTNSTPQTKTGLLTLNRGVTGTEVGHIAFDYPDNSGEDYHLRLYNNAENNNVRYYFKQKSVAGLNDVVLDYPVLAFKNGITIIGANSYPETGLEIEDYYNLQVNPAVRHPLSLYVKGDSVMSGKIKTNTPGASTISSSYWKLGNQVNAYGTTSITKVVEVEVDGVIIELYGRIKP